MRFNFLLLLITTLTAVALSQEWKPHQVKIKLRNTEYYWALDTVNNVILSLQGLNWTTVPFNPTSGSLSSGSISRFNGESVQSFGINNKLTLSKANSNDPKQCWHFNPDGLIQLCNVPNWAATVVYRPVLTTVELRPINSGPQKWDIVKV
ncbi:unnamed protein product [Rhizophagus irregularis]|uniref:Ricin B lectin domain-containing protein n=1 Tax=Rhizophagus irregularis TaxID=588596 RepID=A0A2I1GCL4_9GLOM|nr:hypothetical protein RhiirA4_458648 [Rhizophagus irregularis]CAB4430335.1 unnamed protein product [Rhizophagus irregularis]